MIALSTGSLYSYGVARVFGLAARAGFDGIEVLVDDRWDTRQSEYLRLLSAELDLPIVALHDPFATRVSGWPDDPLERLRCTVSLAEEVGVPLVGAYLPSRFGVVTGYLRTSRVRRFWWPLLIPRRDRYHDFVTDGLGGMERATGIVVAIENKPAKRLLRRTVNPCWFNSPAELKRFPHITLDTTHLATWGYDPLVIYGELKERVRHVHLSNYDGREHRSPPDGPVPLADLLRALACDGYRGAISVECHPDALDAEDEGKCLAALRQAVSYCRRHYDGR